MRQVTQAVRRDLERVRRSYQEKPGRVYRQRVMRVIKEEPVAGTADITDKTQLEWREVSHVSHHGVYHGGEWWGKSAVRAVSLPSGVL